MSTWRIVATWASLAVAMSINGVARELFLKRLVGPAGGDILSAVLGAAIILLTTGYLLRPLAGRPVRDLARASALLVGLALAFELLFGHCVDGKSWDELLAEYALWRGRLWSALLLLVALTPFIWGRWLTLQRVDRRRMRPARPLP